MSDIADRMAIAFHNYYELLASSYGYVTRKDTREFDSESPNGRLMIAVCEKIAGDYVEPLEKRCKELEAENAGHKRRWANIQPQHVYGIGDTNYYVNDAIFNRLHELEAKIQDKPVCISDGGTCALGGYCAKCLYLDIAALRADCDLLRNKIVRRK